VALDTVIVAVDGSELSLDAARTGFALLQPATHTLVVTVLDAGDPSLVVGTGFAGGVMSEAEYTELESARRREGQTHVEAAADALGVKGAETVVLLGHPGATLCELAEQRAARAIVMGSRGRGGIKRAFLGSVSDHVVRNAPCPVVITGPGDAG
jgi:nucleotide-binding universal stress UspA family protein